MKNWCEIRTVCDNEAIESRRLCGDPLKIQATEGNAHKTFVIFVILNAVLWIRNDKSGSSYDILEFQIQTLPILFRNNRNYWEKKIKFNQKEETTNYKPFSSSHGSTVQCTLYSTPSTEFTHLKLEEFFFYSSALSCFAGSNWASVKHNNILWKVRAVLRTKHRLCYTHYTCKVK